MCPRADAEEATFMVCEQLQAISSGYAIRRLGKADAVAGLTLFLSSDAASRITGQTYSVNGG